MHVDPVSVMVYLGRPIVPELVSYPAPKGARGDGPAAAD
jgi:hypothetical protein